MQMNFDDKIENIKMTLCVKENDPSEYYKFGVEYFGPFLYGFARWLYSSVKTKNYDKIFFFSRDGYMMEKAFSILSEEKNLKYEYVYFSRKSIRQALLHKASSYEDSLKYLSVERFVNTGKILEYYGFTKEEREKISFDENVDLEENHRFSSLKDNKKIKCLYQKLKKRIKDYSLQQDYLLKTYVSKIGMNGRCAIVDIGWHGNMQYYLEEYFSDFDDKTELDGYYVGIDPTPKLKSRSYGWLYDADRRRLRKDVLCFFGGYEKLFQSLEGSTYGYEIVDGDIRPVLAEYEYTDDVSAIEHINDWQKGALAFVEIMKKEDIVVSDEIDLALPLVKLGKEPSLHQVKLLSFLYTTDGSKTYFVSQKPIYKYKPKEFVVSLSNSLWKTGFLKSVFKLPLPYFQLYRILRK